MAPKISQRQLDRTLCALYKLTGESLHAHYPLEAVMRKLPPHLRGAVKRAIKQLEKMGLVYRKGGTRSYGITREGLERAREVCMGE
ncbi:MAG: hypothetical protein GSR85_04275 [Desulfurococcales archaeon]|nr:hypothetical protein [Desulfurococcales archaeon]